MVTDSLTGEGLPYAAVVLKGSNVKTATDIDGRFSLSVPNRKGILQVSYMGYVTRDIPHHAPRASHQPVRPDVLR